jgi:uncharacterized phage protein gp47/JayE
MTFDTILNNLIANYISITGRNINKRSGFYGLLNAYAKALFLQRNYIEEQYLKEILIERQTIEELRLTGNVIGIAQNEATSAIGYALIQGNIGAIITNGIQFTNGVNTYRVISDATITLNQQNIFSITRNGTIATVKTSSSHNLATGTILTISGANENNFNRNDISIVVIDNDEFTYIVEDSGSVTATGVIQYSSNFALLNLICNESGSVTNLNNGISLQITTTLTNINDYCLVVDITGGSDEETLTNYANRVMNKFANNTNDYSASLIENTLKDKFNDIKQVKLVKNYSYRVPVSSIRKLTTFEKNMLPQYNNDLYRVYETSIPHNINSIREDVKILNSIESVLNIPTGLEPYAKVYYILDINKIILYVGNNTLEDLTCSTNVIMIPNSDYNSLFILKNTTDKYPSPTELITYKDYINENTLPFTDSNYYHINSFEKLEVSFEVNDIVPNNEGMKQSIRNNLIDYFTNYVKGGQYISELTYYNIVSKSSYNNQKIIDYSIVCRVNGIITNNINTQIYEYPDLISVITN